jgi:uncharacterized protein YqeY
MNNERIERMDKLIAEAMKNKEMNKVATLRLVKTKMLEFVTAKNAKPLDEAAEMQILKKMATERKESIKIYEEAGRTELAEKERVELDVISEFLPKETTDEEINAKIDELINSGKVLEQKTMGLFIKEIKAAYPGADGSKVAQLVKARI